MISTSKIGVASHRGGGGGGGASGLVTDGLILNLDSTNTSSYPGTGTVWSDLSGEGNHFDLVNGPTFSTDDGGTIITDGTNDYIKSQGNIDEVNAANSTFAYVKCTELDSHLSGGNYNTLVFSKAFNSAAYNNIDIRFLATTSQWSTYSYMSIYVHLRNATTTLLGYEYGWNFTPVPQILEDQWYYIGFTTDGTSGGDVNMYVNGVNVGSFTLSGERTPTTTKPTVLANDSWSRSLGMPGSNRNYHQYTKELSDAEVLQNYNAIKL